MTVARLPRANSSPTVAAAVERFLKAKSRHTSLRSLEKYVSPSRDAVKKLTDDHDPVARRQR